MSYKSVLIIHDYKPERELFREFLSTGFSDVVVKEVESELEADQLLDQQHFDVVLSSVIYKRLAELSRKGTNVIILIEQASQEKLDELSKYGLQNYQVFPTKQEILRDKINAVIRKGVSRKFPRFDVPDTEVIFHIGITDIEGKVLNISEEGILCEVNMEGNYEYLLKDLCLTIKFPRKYGNKIFRNLNCNYLVVRKSQKEGFRTTLQIVFLLPIMTGKQLEEFKKTLLKIIRKQNPIVKWRISRLEVTFRGATYLFYSIHLFRISILITIFVAFIAFLVWHFSEEKFEIVWTNGQIYSRSEGEIDWEKAKEKIFSADALIRIADGEPENQEKMSESADHSATSSRKNHFAVLKYPPSEIVILSQKGSIKREKKRENSTAYQFTGAAHLLLQPRRAKPPHRWLINGFEFFTESAHLFFQDLTSPSELTVVTGAIAIYPQQDLFLSIADEIQPQSGQIVLTSKHSIRITKETIDLKLKSDSVVQYFEDTFLPGFTTEGDYQQIGYAIVEAGGFDLKRHSNSYHIRIKTTPLMLHDVITTGLNDKVVLKLHTNDLMRLYANGEIAIREFTLPVKYPLLPLIIGVNAQESINGNQADFQIAGKVRAVINPQIKNRRFRLRSANAVVGVKGTDFEANVSGEMTEVLTVIGAVDLSDKDEKKSVTIYRGMMSHIRENQPPVQPTEIPKERMLILLKESLDADDRLYLSSFNTIDPGHLILEAGSPVSLYWNNGLRAAEVILNDRIYPLNVTRDSAELIIDQETFNEVEPKVYKAKIKVVDTKKRIATIETELDIRPHVKVTENRIVFSEKIQFEKGRSIIKSESFNLLNEIIRAIKANQQIRLISIEGHTDSDGSEKYNRELSENRAEAVKHYLVQHGISKNSIQAKGFGESKPIASNTNDLEKMKNRRVEFFIQTKVPEQK